MLLLRGIVLGLIALTLSGCIDSERLREDFGPRDYERSERAPNR